jgi:muramidase (phage lysozyme)
MARPRPGTAGRVLCGRLPSGAYQKCVFVREIVARRIVNQIAAGRMDQVFCLIRLVSSAIWL